MPPPTASPLPPPSAPDQTASATAADDTCASHGFHLWNGLFRGHGFAGLGLAHSASQVPSQQGPDYASPQPKFHPIPTHPVFEPLLAYPPPQLIDVGGSNPLRASRPPGSGIFGAGIFIPVASRFSAKDSRPLPTQEPIPAPPTPPPDR
jgi:hypothetical protein